jgi:hypothetical protein
VTTGRLGENATVEKRGHMPELEGYYVKKPIPVKVRMVTESEVVLTAHGRVRAEPGDYILTDPVNGDTWPIKPDYFAANYTAI